MNGEIDAAAAAQDDALGAAGLVFWVGSEPTFTDRRAETPEWLSEALGGDKEARARRLLAALSPLWPGAVVVRTLGRQYRGEPGPRWSYGLYARRDGAALWDGPPDPLQCPESPPPQLPADAVVDLLERLAAALRGRGWPVERLAAARADEVRLVFRCDGGRPAADPKLEPELLRPSWHDGKLPEAGVSDRLAADGDYLVTAALAVVPGSAAAVPVVDLPQLPEVAVFAALLADLGAAARGLGLPGLVLRGHPPPVDATVAFTTVTPDPAVIEVNMAPAADAATFLHWHRGLYAAAAAVGLSAVRFHYNGAQTDSGGGGQLTLGGPAAADSAFLRNPRLLPRLVRYLVRHPALSYCFATDYLGGASQAPRPDEGTWDRVQELRIALRQLERGAEPSAELLWQTLSDFLCDASGNLHRSELNIEKLWNPHLPGRGKLGLVEFRAFRMQQDAEAATALAMLLRGVCAMLCRADPVPDLVFWGTQLHERFALPFYLRRDLHEVFGDLAEQGLALPAAVQRQLAPDAACRVGSVGHPALQFCLDSALEFWPLLGDVASQESGGSRLVDASSRRLQVLLEPRQGSSLADWQVAVNGLLLPLRAEDGDSGQVGVFGVRYRAFNPWRGLHPRVPAQDPLQLCIAHRSGSPCWRVRVHEWAPAGGGYPGLPGDATMAARRRAERFVVEPDGPVPLADAPSYALTDYTLDLRCLTD